ncbi:MAG: urease accessory protein UreH domain-containing protein, partial [Bacteroidia bacterium]
IAGAIATGNTLLGSFFMATFGLGTLPAMFALVLISNSLSMDFRKKINKTIPVFTIAMALLLILRGMNLGIPYVSPEMSAVKPVCNKCCHK